MATLKLTEVIADAIIDKLQAGLATRATAINTEKNDGIEISPPATGDYYVGRFGQGSLTPVRTAICVTEEASPDYGEEGPHSFIFASDVTVWIIEADLDSQTLARKLWRQARAVVEVIWDDDPKERLTNSAFWLMPVRHRPGPTFEPQQEETQWSSLYGVVFRCKQIEG